MSLLDSIAFIDGLVDPPTVMTTSYGDTESSYGASTATSVSHFQLGERITDFFSRFVFAGSFAMDTWPLVHEGYRRYFPPEMCVDER
jgi:hypothetical protein